MNGLPKYVVSSTLEEPRWSNATVLKGEVADEVTKLKQELDGDIVVYASYQLGRTLMEHDLVDELRLVVFPVVLGAGERLFGETSDKKPVRLVNTKTIGDGLHSHLRDGPGGLGGAGRRQRSESRMPSRDRAGIRASCGSRMATPAVLGRDGSPIPRPSPPPACSGPPLA